MKEKRTSLTSPLQIAEVLVPAANGSIGMTICPGKKDAGRNWDRDLRTDLQAIRKWGATMVVTLIEPHECRMLSVEALESEVRGLGMN